MQINLQINAFDVQELDRLADLYGLPDSMEHDDILVFLFEHMCNVEHNLDIDLEMGELL